MHVESFKFQNRILNANHDAQQSIKEKDSPLFLNFPASRGFFFLLQSLGCRVWEKRLLPNWVETHSNPTLDWTVQIAGSMICLLTVS